MVLYSTFCGQLIRKEFNSHKEDYFDWYNLHMNYKQQRIEFKITEATVNTNQVVIPLTFQRFQTKYQSLSFSIQISCLQLASINLPVVSLKVSLLSKYIELASIF